MLETFPKKKNSFTLIELLVVITIIGILSTMVLVSMAPVRQKARDARRMADFSQISLAMEICYGDSNCAGGPERYPAIVAGPDAVTQIDTDGQPLYLFVQKDPLDISPQQYTWTTNESPYQYYCVYVKLEAETETWFCASNKGVLKKTEANYTPSNSNCCGVNVTQ